MGPRREELTYKTYFRGLKFLDIVAFAHYTRDSQEGNEKHFQWPHHIDTEDCLRDYTDTKNHSKYCNLNAYVCGESVQFYSHRNNILELVSRLYVIYF